MKTLDRYILGLFLKNYVISLTVIIGLYVVMDMVFKFDQIVRIDKSAGTDAIENAVRIIRDIGDYYFYQAFLIFVMMSGIIPVVAAAFTLMRLSRFNELTAFIAAGVPMLRLAAPVVIAAAFLNMLLVVDQEWVLPAMIPKLVRSHDQLHQQGVDQWYSIKSMQVDQRSLLIASRYYPSVLSTPAHMTGVDILDRNENLQTTGHLYADRADWNPQASRWDLTNGFYVDRLLPGQIPLQPRAVASYPGVVTPDEISIYRGSAYVELLSTRKINELIARPKSYGVAGLYKIKSLRWSQPFMNVVLLLLAIPSVMSFDPKGLKTAATRCLILLAAAMSCVFVCQQMANHPPLGPQWVSAWPTLMAWIPIFCYGPLAVWMMAEKLRT